MVYNINKTNFKNSIKLIDTNSRVKFFTGKYMYKIGDNCLEIKSNGKYNFKAGQYLITEGSWSQKGNILLLTDMSNKHTYKVLISNENEIINLTLPSYDDNKFYLIK